MSILDQTHENLELIVILDKIGTSKDNAVIERLNAFKDDHRLLTIVHRKRIGFVHSLNEGISVSRGEYIARADSDDISIRDRFVVQKDYLKIERKDLVGAWAYVMNNSGETIGRLRLPSSTEGIRKSIMLHNVVVHGSVLMKKEILKKSGLYLPEFFGSEDYELWLRLISKGYLLANCPEYLVFLRENPDSITRGKAWFKSRVSYIRSKEYAWVRYGYRTWADTTLFLASFFLLFAHPSISISLKKMIGIYTSNDLVYNSR